MPFYVLIIVAIVCIVVTALVTLTVRKNTVEKKVGNAEEKAREIIDDALKVAERSKREALLEAKEERSCSVMSAECLPKRKLLTRNLMPWNAVS